MRKKGIYLLLCVLVLLNALCISASADMGPKPSVRITFEGLGDEPCYGTLLSADKSTGPASAWNGNESDIDDWSDDFDYEIWKTFVEYEDPDGYYFLQMTWRVDETGQLNWTYYPPDPFKILLYFPESGTFLSSGIYERYAFDSYFAVDMTDFDIGVVQMPLNVERSYDYSWEIVSLLARIVLTILLELVIAWFFGYRSKAQITWIIIVNLITQTVLNVLLNVINYNQGQMMFAIYYFTFELIVLAIEAVVFFVVLHKYSETTLRTVRPLVYAFCANVVSCAAGFAIAKWIPGIF